MQHTEDETPQPDILKDVQAIIDAEAARLERASAIK